MRVTESKFPPDSAIDVCPVIYRRRGLEGLHIHLGRYTPFYSIRMPRTELKLLSRSQRCLLGYRINGVMYLEIQLFSSINIDVNVLSQSFVRFMILII